MKVAVRHRTRYDYATPPALGLQRLRLEPAPVATQHVAAWSVRLDGLEIEAAFTDHNGNRITLASVSAEALSVEIEVEGVVETRGHDGVVGAHDGPPLWLYRRATSLTHVGDGIASLASDLAPSDAASFHRLSDAVRARMPWTVGATHADTTGEAALAKGAGVCQDHAHVFVAACRARGVPARYVSGYLLMNDREEQEASHAWAEAHLPGLGWVGFDVSNGYSPDERYVRLASGLDYRDAAPISGLLRFPGARPQDDLERLERLTVGLHVSRVPATSQGRHQDQTQSQ